HRCEMVTLSPRWEAFDPGPPTRGEALWPTVTRYTKMNTGWQGKTLPLADGDGDGKHIRGALLTEKECTTLRAHSEVVIRTLAGSDATVEPLSYTWGGFFPSVPEPEREGYAYPLPLSDEFWQLYAEPIDLFISAARSFRDT